MKHLGDITKINGAEIPVVDIITGGSPCQDLSVAGKRAGLQHSYLGDEETTRSGLFMDQLRIVKEMRESDRRKGRHGVDVRPRYMVWENVPGAFSSNGGKDFQAVLSEIVRVVEPSSPDVPMPEKGWPYAGCLYDELGGWSVAYRVHDAQYWGVPQRRRRIALVADFNGLSAPEILFDPQLRGEAQDSEPHEAVRDSGTERKPQLQSFGDSLQRNPDESGAAGEGTSEGPVRCAAEPEKLSFQERAGKPGGAKESSYRVNEQEPCQLSTTNTPSIDGPEAYGISPFDSNAMKSENPHSGFYKADTARTLDLNGGNPACHQGWGTGSSPYCGDRLPERDGKPFCERHSASERAGDEPQQQQRSQSADEVMRVGQHVPDVAHALKAKANCDYREDSETYVCRQPQFFQNTGIGWWNNGDVAETIRTPCGGDSTKANLAITPPQAIDGYNGAVSETVPTLGINCGLSTGRNGVISAGFLFGQSEHARSIGYHEECSPTIRGGEGGNQKPCVVTINKSSELTSTTEL